MKKSLIAVFILVFVIAGGAFYFLVQNKTHSLTPSYIKKSSVSKPAVSVSATKTIVPPPVPRQASEDKIIQDIRRELQSVMDLNKKISITERSQSAQLHRIQEQALIHQKILSEIQRTVDLKKSQKPSREALLAQEKLRIIREETLRNKKLLENTSRRAAS